MSQFIQSCNTQCFIDIMVGINRTKYEVNMFIVLSTVLNAVLIHGINMYKHNALSRSGLYLALYEEGVQKHDDPVANNGKKIRHSQDGKGRQGWGTLWGGRGRGYGRRNQRKMKSTQHSVDVKIDKTCNCGISKDLMQV